MNHRVDTLDNKLAKLDTPNENSPDLESAV